MKRNIGKYIAASAAVAMSSFGAVTLAPAASADTLGCVTRGEYRQVYDHMTIKRVHAIFDTVGTVHRKFSKGHSRLYRVCNIYPEKYAAVVRYMPMSGQVMVINKSWSPR
ncbi:MAG TPA: hypothetical protein VES21_02460 [Nocardioidaceae bacterium]|nr:hypothetical protein [Nocardioidaceae bacterium]